MKRSHLPFNALKAFEAAARLRSLGRAAEELSVTHGAVSHQIKSLENLLGRALLDRRCRPIKPTSAGEQLLVAVGESFDRLSRVTDAIARDELEGELRVSCVPGLASNWLVPSLGAFLASHANIRIHVETEYWREPVMIDRVDLAVAYGSAEHPGSRVVLLGQSEFYPVASPRLIDDRWGLPTPEKIAQSTLLHECTNETWMRWFASVGLTDASAGRGVTFDGAHLSLEAARAGYGIAMADTITVKRDLEERKLIRVSPVAVPAAYPYYLIISPQMMTHPAVQALEAWLIANYKTFD